jgi:hypothetical protein
LPDALAKLSADAIANDGVWKIASIQQIIKICSVVKPVCSCLDGSNFHHGRLMRTEGHLADAFDFGALRVHGVQILL